MKLISEYEAPQEIKVLCDAFRILGLCQETNSSEKETLEELFALCSKESDFKDVFYAAYVLSLARVKNTYIFDYVMCQILLQKKIINFQPMRLTDKTIEYFNQNGIPYKIYKSRPYEQDNCDLINIIKEDDIEKFLEHTLYETPDNLSIKVESKIVEGTVLEIATALNAEKIVKHLLMNESDPTQAAVMATAFGNLSILRLLVQSGADISLVYNQAVASHQYDIIDWIRLNYDNINSEDIELKSNNVLAFLTKENEEVSFEQALIALENNNFTMFKYLWGAKEPPPGTDISDISQSILYLFISGEHEFAKALLKPYEEIILDSDHDYLRSDIFMYSEPDVWERILPNEIFTLNTYEANVMAALGKKENAKAALNRMIDAQYHSPNQILTMLCINKTIECAKRAIEAGIDFTYKDDQSIPYLLLYGTKDVEFTKYVSEHSNVIPNFTYALNVAIIRRDLDMIKFVLENIPKSSTKEYSTFDIFLTHEHHHPLQVATVLESIPALELLLNVFDINESSADGTTALHYAAVIGNFELFNFLLSKGADIRKETSTGNTVLHIAAINENFEIVKRIVELTGTDLLNKVASTTKLTPICASLRFNRKKNRQIYDYLLEKGAKLNVEGAMTPLMCAIISKNSDENLIIELMDNPEIDINAEIECFKGKANALHYAINHQMDNIARMLIDRGARCIDCPFGFPDIGSAIFFLEKDIPYRLINEKRYKESDKYPAMLFAVAKRDTSLIEAILEVSERPEDIETGIYEMTPLKVAVLENNTHLVDLLIKKGASLHASKPINEMPIPKTDEVYEDSEVYGVFDYPPMGFVGNSFEMEFYSGTPLDLALWKGDDKMLELLGLQGTGAMPEINEEYIVPDTFLRINSHNDDDKRTVLYMNDVEVPNIGNLDFGTIEFAQNDMFYYNIEGIFQDNNLSICPDGSGSLFFPRTRYL